MSEPTCELARENVIRDDGWRQHAATCPDCRELTTVINWMTSLAKSTAPRHLPAPGYLLFKAQIRQRFVNADRVALPVQVMTIVAGLLLVAAIVGLFSVEPRVASIMFNAFGLVLSFTGLIAVAAGIVLIAAAIAAYFGDHDKALHQRQRNDQT